MLKVLHTLLPQQAYIYTLSQSPLWSIQSQWLQTILLYLRVHTRVEFNLYQLLFTLPCEPGLENLQIIVKMTSPVFISYFYGMESQHIYDISFQISESTLYYCDLCVEIP